MTTSVNSILVIALPGIGDVLVTTPLLAALRATYPEARIDLLIRKGMRGIVEGNPHINDVIEVPRRAGVRATMSTFKGRWRAYDVVLSNSASDRAFFYSLVLGRKRYGRLLPRSESGFKHRFHADYTVIDADRHALSETSELGRMIGVDVDPVVVPPYSATAPEKLESLLGPTWRDQPYAAIHPGPSLVHKRWQIEGWRDIVAQLGASGLHVYVSGGPVQSEKDYIEKELLLDSNVATSLAGQLSLAEVAELLARARICVCVDTLIGHVSTAVGTPTVVLFGGTNLRQWAPWPYGHPATKSPYAPDGSQRIGNVYVLHAPPATGAVEATRTLRTPHGSETGLQQLGSSVVIDAVQSMLDSKGNSDTIRECRSRKS